MGKADGQEGILLSNDTAAKVEEILKNAQHHGSITFTFQKMYIHFMSDWGGFVKRCYRTKQ
jgi:hypothetical protein